MCNRKMRGCPPRPGLCQERRRRPMLRRRTGPGGRGKQDENMSPAEARRAQRHSLPVPQAPTREPGAPYPHYQKNRATPWRATEGAGCVPLGERTARSANPLRRRTGPGRRWFGLAPIEIAIAIRDRYRLTGMRMILPIIRVNSAKNIFRSYKGHIRSYKS